MCRESFKESLLHNIQINTYIKPHTHTTRAYTHTHKHIDKM